MTKIFPTADVLPDGEYVPLFAQRAGATLQRCEETFTKRGDQYGDTWRDCQWLKLKAILFTMFGMKPTVSQCRAMALASLADQKYYRMLGGYCEDHILDGINYNAALAEEMREVYKEPSGRIGRGGIEFKQARPGEPIQVRVNGEWTDL